MKTRYLPIILIVVGLGLAFAVQQSFKGLTPAEHISQGKPLAFLSDINGQVSVLPYSSSTPKTTEGSEYEIFHMDLVETQSNSTVTAKLPSGYELQLLPESKILFEAWGRNENSPTYLHVFSGGFKMLRAGQRGQVFVQQNRKLIYPEGNVYLDNYHLTINAPEFLPADNSLEQAEQDISDSESEQKPLAPQAPKSETTDLPETLSNEEIDQALASQRLQFERCQTNALRENLPAQGRILVGISVDPSGKIQDVHAITSDLNNPSFQSCVLSVFQRVQLRPFSGSTITRSYPLLFD